MQFCRFAPAIILATAFAGCPAPELPTTALPGGLALAGLTTAQQGLVRATLEISGGALNETELVLGDGLTTLSGTFDVDNVAARVQRELTLRVYGRFAETSEEVLLGRIVKPITLEPAKDVEIAFGQSDVFDTCGGDDGACAVVFDANRNGVKNIDDLLERERSGGRGIDPAPQPASLVTSSEQMQFPSGVRLGSFSRQLVVLENLGADPVVVTEAAVIGGQGFAISILDPTGLSVAPPGRVLDDDAFATIAPGQEAFVAVSFSPANAFVTTGAVFVRLKDQVSLVEQTVRVKLIANPEGELRPADAAYVEPDLTGLASETGIVAVTPFPNAPLHSGDAVIAEALLPGGLKQTGAALTIVDDGEEVVFPVDAAFAVDIAPGERFSTAIDGLGADVDIAVVAVDDVGNGVGESVGLACAACRSANAGTSPEAVEFKNDGAARRVLVLLGRIEPAPSDVDSDDDNSDTQALTVAETVPFRLATTVSAGPEFAAVDPLSPTTGPLEGGVTVVVRGSGFHPRAHVRVGGADALDIAVTRLADDVDSVSFTLPASAGLENPASIVIENPVDDLDDDGDGQAATLLEAFTYLPPAPVIDEISPDVGPTTGGTVPVVITGRFFSNRFGPPRVAFNDVVVDAIFGNAAELRVLAPPTADVTTAADVKVRVTNRIAVDDVGGPVLGSDSNLVDFHYVVPAGPAPTVTSVSPSSGSIDGGVAVLIDGTGLRDGLVVLFGTRAGLCLPLASSTRVTCRAPASDVAGLVDVVVVNSDGQSGARADAFTYTIPAPSVTSVFPTRGSTSGGTLTIVEGTGFRDGVRVSFGQDATTHPAAAVTRVGSTTLLVTTPAGVAGAATVTIRNPDAQTVTTTFTYAAPDAPAPTIRALSPASGDLAGGDTLVISGTGFVDAVVVFGQTRVAATFVESVAPALDELTVVVPSSSTAGPVTVQVLNSDGQSASAPFTYTAPPVPAPRIDRVVPSTFIAGAAAAFSIDGARFDGAAKVFIGGRAATVTSSTDAQILGSFDGQLEPGIVMLVVENPDGRAVNAAVTVVAPSTPTGPVVTSVSNSDVHANVAGDVITVFGDHLDEGTVSATVTASSGGVPIDALITSRGRNVLAIELPAMPSAPSRTSYALSLQFTTTAPTVTTVTVPLVAHRPTVVFSELDDDGAAAELVLLGDFFHPDALEALELVSSTTRLPCTITTATERAVVCSVDLEGLPAGRVFVPTLTWRGVFGGEQQAPFELTGAAIGLDGVVTGEPVSLEPTTVVGLTDYAVLPQTLTFTVAGFDPTTPRSPLRLRVDNADVTGSVVGNPGSMTVTLNGGFVADVASAPFSIETDDGVLARGELVFAQRTVGFDPGVRPVTWPAGLVFTGAGQLPGDVTRLVARRVGSTVSLAVPAALNNGSVTPTSTAALAPGEWELCFSDQLARCERSNARVRVEGVHSEVLDGVDNGIDTGPAGFVTDVIGPGESDSYFFFVDVAGELDVDFNGCNGANALLKTRAGATLGNLCGPAVRFVVQPGEHVVTVNGIGFSEYSLFVGAQGPVVGGGGCNNNGTVDPDEQCDEPGTGQAGCNGTCIEGEEANDATGMIIGEAPFVVERTLSTDDTDRFRFTVTQAGNFTVDVSNRQGVGCFGTIVDAFIEGPGGSTPLPLDAEGCITSAAALTQGEHILTLRGTATPLKYRVELLAQLECGDGELDPGEDCDEGAAINGQAVNIGGGFQVLCEADCREPTAPDMFPDVFNVGRTITPGDSEEIFVTVPQRSTLGVFTVLRPTPAQPFCGNRVSLTILDTQGRPVAGTTTDGNGGCAFASVVVPAGRYVARVSGSSQFDRFRFTVGAFITPAPAGGVCGDSVIAGEAIGTPGRGTLVSEAGLFGVFGGIGAGVAVGDNDIVYAVKNDGLRAILRRLPTGEMQSAAQNMFGAGADLEIGPDGFLYLADGRGLNLNGTPSNRILRVAPAGASVGTFISNVDNPTGLAFGDDGLLYVALFDLQQIHRFDAISGVFMDVFATLEIRPLDIELGSDGTLYVAGFSTQEQSQPQTSILAVDAAGDVTTFATGLNDPHSLAFDKAGTLFVSDYNNSRLVKIDPEGLLEVAFELESFEAPNGIAIGQNGTLYTSLNDNSLTELTNITALGTEECDDGNTGGGDGCSAQCRDEGGIAFGAPNTITRRGTETGQVVEDFCDTGSVLVGVSARVDGSIDGLSAVCARVLIDDDTLDIVGPYTLPLRGAPVGRSAAARCPAGTAVTGVSGRSDIAIDALAFSCAPLAANNGVVSVGANTGSTAEIGGGGGVPFVLTGCGASKVARGISIHVDSTVNSFALVCGAPQ